MIEIKTANRPVPLLSLQDLTPKERREFDYITDEWDVRLFRYKGWVYDLYEFERPSGVILRHSPEFAKWDGYQSDSFFSGIVIRFHGDDHVIPGTYFS